MRSDRKNGRQNFRGKGDCKDSEGVCASRCRANTWQLSSNRAGKAYRQARS